MPARPAFPALTPGFARELTSFLFFFLSPLARRGLSQGTLAEQVSKGVIGELEQRPGRRVGREQRDLWICWEGVFLREQGTVGGAGPPGSFLPARRLCGSLRVLYGFATPHNKLVALYSTYLLSLIPGGHEAGHS